MNTENRPKQEAFTAAINALKQVLHKITPDRRNFNEQFLKKWTAIFKPSNIPFVGADEIVSFTSFSENQHWSGIHRQNSTITSDLDALRRTLTVLLDESRDITSRINEIDPLRSQKPVKGLGTAVYTAILAVAYPDRYPVMNRKSRDFLKRFELLTSRRADPASVRYAETIERCRELTKELGCTLLELDELFHHSLEAMGDAAADTSDNEDDAGTPKIWVISAGEEASKWSDFQSQGIIAIGWTKLGNLSLYKTDEDVENAIREHYRTKMDDSRPVNDTRACYDFAHSIAVGDTVVAKQGQSIILGVGKVTSDYQFVTDSSSEWPNQRKVTWIRAGLWTLPDNARVPIKTLTEVTHYINFTSFLRSIHSDEGLASTFDQAGSSLKFTGFGSESFQILEEFRKNPVIETYMNRRAGFKQHLAEPLALLVKDLAPNIQEVFGGVVETHKNITSRIPKNDYGRGGIHYHYWMAFYPKGTKRTTGTQLFIYIHPDHIAAGFAQGARAFTFLERLKKALEETDFDFDSYIEHLASTGFQIADFDENGRREGSIFQCSPTEARRVLAESSRVVIERMWSRDEAIKLGAGLAPLIHQVMKDIVPLFALASFEDYEQYLPDFTEITEVNDHLDGIIAEPMMAPPLDTEQGWSHLNKELNWTDNCEELRLLKAIFNRAIVGKDHASKQIILVGPPGTGKTKLAKQLSEGLATSRDNIAMVQFHQSYSYEDFIEGIRPRTIQGQMTYQEVAGPFVEFCRRASRPAHRDERFVFIIDEINRGNVSRIFGELLYLLEYRTESMPLLYSKNQFSIPSNVFIIATMNCADRSLALVDYALRRRFRFIDLSPSSDVLRFWYKSGNHEHETAIRFFELLNSKLPDPRLRVGHSYFLDTIRRDVGLDRKATEEIWVSAVKPLLQEYFATTPHRISDYDFDSLWKEAARAIEAEDDSAVQLTKDSA
jgi:5-methylcytosine-specific restriction protein B